VTPKRFAETTTISRRDRGDFDKQNQNGFDTRAAMGIVKRAKVFSSCFFLKSGFGLFVLVRFLFLRR
jgi:hypothetical protein